MKKRRRFGRAPRTVRPAGFTLVELLIAMAIVGALLVIAFGGLRVVLAASQRGEERVEVHQHLRSARRRGDGIQGTLELGVVMGEIGGEVRGRAFPP